MEAWPVSVQFLPISGTVTADPFRAPLVTDMEGGNVRRRRTVSKNIATLPMTIHMENDEFLTFKSWVRDTLVDGTLPFTMNVWTGAAYEQRVCSFAKPYQDNPADGFRHDVALQLDVEDY